jgi:hypothetical protein
MESMMSNVPWFTIATMLTALGSAMAGMAGGLEPETAAKVSAFAVAVGGLGKAAYNIGEAMKGNNEPINE